MGNRNLRSRLRTRVAVRYLVVALAVLIATAVILATVVIFIEYRIELDRLEEHVTETADFVSAVSPEAVLFNDFLPLETLMREATSDAHVVYSIVFDNDGRALTRYLDREEPLVAAVLEEGSASDVQGVITAVRANALVEEIRRPIVSEGVQLGEVWLGYSIESARVALVRSMVIAIGLVVLLSLVLAIPTVLLFNWLIGRPLQELSDAALALEAGDLTRRTAVDEREDEIGQLQHAFNAMAEQLEETLVEARKLSQVASRTDNMVIISNADGRIEWVNEAFERTTEYSVEEAVGQRPGGFLQGPDTDPATVAMMRESVSNGRGFKTEVVNYTKSGRAYWVEIEVQPVRDDAGRLSHFIAIESDITVRREAREALRRAKESAEAADRAKSEFLANMSHEIRTPMNAVIGLSGLLLDTPLDEEQRDYVDTIRQSGDSLLTILNDILDFSKIEAGRMELENAPFDVRDCVTEALDLFVVDAGAKQLDLAYFVEPAVPLVVNGDMTRLRQVLVNLISNAVKFTESGEVAVTVWGERLNGRQHRLSFSVRDTGIGIPPDRAAQVFKPFTQLDASTTRKYGGTGLGLVICRRLVEMMGGTITVESVPDEGSTFTFQIVVEESGKQPVRPRMDTRALAGRRVLIVDDNETNRRIAGHYITSWQMEPTLVASGREALAVLEEDSFDVAILDVHMPEMDGIMLAEIIQRDPALKALPLIILSSTGRTELGVNELDLVAYLNKPLKPKQLHMVLMRLFGEEDVAAGVEEPVEGVFESDLAERHPLRILLAEDNLVNQKVALRMLEKFGYTADLAVNGVEVLTAVDQRQYDLVLMDIQMPEMDGVAATKHIRAHVPPEQQPTIVAITAHALEGDREFYLESGMDDYITKPVRVEALVAALKQARRVPGGDAEGAPATNGRVEAAPVVVDDELVDMDVLRAQLGSGADQMLAEVMPVFLEETAVLVQRLADAQTDGDAERVRRAAHTIKGASATVGITRLSALAKEVEQYGREGALDATPPLIAEIEALFARVTAVYGK